MSDLQQVTQWAEALIAQHLDDGWAFAYDHAKRRAGLCDYGRKRISMSRYLTARYDDETNRQTLLHEIAHALAGRKAGHGAVWLRTARGLGYTGARLHDGETAVELAPWVGTCPSGHIVYRHRRPSRPSSCVTCARAFDPRFLFAWQRREITPADRAAAMTPR